MKKLTLTLIAMFALSFIYAQTVDDYVELVRTQLKADKKVVVTEVLQLSKGEGDVFWPLYNEYNNAMYAIQTERVKLIKDFAANYEKMTSEKADELILKAFEIKKDLLSLDKKYYAKFKKIIPVTKAATYFQLENKIETLVNAQLAIDIPLLQGK
jgi:hypothetical protein